MLYFFTDGIYLKSNSALNYRTINRYTLTVRCTDTKDYTDKKFYVDILNNQPPFFNNLPGKFPNCFLINVFSRDKEIFMYVLLSVNFNKIK